MELRESKSPANSKDRIFVELRSGPSHSWNLGQNKRLLNHCMNRILIIHSLQHTLTGIVR